MNKLIVLAIIICAAFTRLVPHPPNFTPIIAMGLFGGAYLKDSRMAIMFPVLAMLLSDIFLGFHSTMVWVYGSLILIALIGTLYKNKITYKSIGLGGAIGSLLFFLITNLGVWLSSSFYPKTFNGLASCYIAGLPFLSNTLISSLLYVSIMFFGYELLKNRSFEAADTI